jgi:hypothetical protein
MSNPETLDRQRAALDRVGTHLADEIVFWWNSIEHAMTSRRLHSHYGRSKIIREILVRYHGVPTTIALRDVHDAAMHARRIAKRQGAEAPLRGRG